MYLKDDKFASYKLLGEALKEKGYTMAISSGPPPTIATYTSPAGAVWQTKASHIAYPFNSEKTRDILNHKSRTYQLAREVNFSVPFTMDVTDDMDDQKLEQALDRFNSLIVKPEDSSLSKGLTLGITSLSELRQAIAYAKTFSPTTLIQQQVVGEEIRFTVIDGKVEAALLRSTARVIGNGHSSVAELIRQENEERKKLHFAHLTYPQLNEKMVDKHYFESIEVPADGEVVELNHSTMIRGGCSIYNILSKIHESYIKLVESLVENVEAGFVVVDVFCEDYTLPATPNNHWLIEFNGAPVLKLYYSCRDGNQFDIVTRLANTIDDYLHRRKLT